MILSGGDILTKHAYYFCDGCSKSPDDIKRHFFYVKKHECQECGKVSLIPSLRFDKMQVGQPQKESLLLW